jgi:hypothetical protein
MELVVLDSPDDQTAVGSGLIIVVEAIGAASCARRTIITARRQNIVRTAGVRAPLAVLH